VARLSITVEDYMSRRFTGLFALLVSLLAISGCAPKEPQIVEVTLTDFTIEVDQTTFEAGQPYEFVITNEGALPHEFVVMPPLHEGEDSGHDMGHEAEALLAVGEDELPPGETVTVSVTFPQAAAGEDLEFACHIAGHYEANMRKAIEIN
jgi:uncharacterized cupredoxin-like copper-binding protein